MAKAARPESGLLPVRVQPRARRNVVQDWRGTTLRVSVTAAPSDGQANRAVAELLAAVFGVSVSSVELVRGASSRDKLFRVGRLSLDDLRARLAGARA